MSRLFTGVLAGVALMLPALAANADRLITIPTGNNLSTGGVRAEFQQEFSGHDGQIFWANIGFPYVEIEAARFQNFGVKTTDAVSAQISVLPESTLTPGVAVGARDFANTTDNKLLPYDGRAFYLAVSKKIPLSGAAPVLIRDLKLDAGVGTGSLGGVFLGAEGKLPAGIHAAAEYDTRHFNGMLYYTVVPKVRLDVGFIGSNGYAGAQFSTGF